MTANQKNKLIAASIVFLISLPFLDYFIERMVFGFNSALTRYLIGFVGVIGSDYFQMFVAFAAGPVLVAVTTMLSVGAPQRELIRLPQDWQEWVLSAVSVVGLAATLAVSYVLTQAQLSKDTNMGSVFEFTEGYKCDEPRECTLFGLAQRLEQLVEIRFQGEGGEPSEIRSIPAPDFVERLNRFSTSIITVCSSILLLIFRPRLSSGPREAS